MEWGGGGLKLYWYFKWEWVSLSLSLSPARVEREGRAEVHHRGGSSKKDKEKDRKPLRGNVMVTVEHLIKDTKEKPLSIKDTP